MVFNRRMKPIFDALGIELVVRNIAHGANPCRPSDLCYEAMGGDNPDWLSWEQSYNCKSADIFELMAKTAVLNRARLFITASGAFVPDHCEMSNVGDSFHTILFNKTQHFTSDGYNMKPPCHDQGEYYIGIRIVKIFVYCIMIPTSTNQEII